MTRRSLQALTGGVLVVALVVMGAGFPARRVPPKQWAAGVCTVVGSWVDGAQQGSVALPRAAAGDDGDIGRARKALVAYLSATADATGAVRSKLARVGTPDTPKGERAAQGLRRGFEKVHVAVTRLERQARRVSTENPVRALADLRRLQAKIDVEFGALDQAFNHLDRLDPGHKLARAFKAARACRSVAG